LNPGSEGGEEIRLGYLKFGELEWVGLRAKKPQRRIEG